MAKIPKYRPSLPPILIEKVLELAKKETPLSSESIQLISILAPFQAKIESNGLTPAHTSAPKLTLKQSIGLDPTPSEWVLDGREYATKEDYWLACYTIHIKDVTRLSLQEIQAAREYMYLHYLLTDSVLKEFEQETTTT